MESVDRGVDGARTAAPDAGSPSAPPLDRHALYEHCVQAPERLVPHLRAVHGGAPTVLGEDFCGTAALARAWVRLVPNGRAIALDHDPDVLERAARDARRDGVLDRIELACGDARAASDPERHRCDVLFVGNFSLGELATRGDLLAYLRRARARLASDGTFICDTYGGANAFRTGAVERVHLLPDGRRIRYTWEQRFADPRTARVVNALHFRVEHRGEIVQEFTDAFVYRWRLWSLAELADAFQEVGFTDVRIWQELADDELDARAVEAPEQLGESWIVCTSARSRRS
ncbi:MAG: methyltransferase domain-containing protein [Planctomycetes bacterium]|nr:methyltransferase domain-containing protein [Planctomycetota bacterium]